MWLLDANLPIQLVPLLAELGVSADSAVARGWNTLSNGKLVSTASDAKFTVLLTRDRFFAETGTAALKAHPDFCVVQIMLLQLRAREFLSAFNDAWQAAPMIPSAG
jgi:predicted nuclease of predicted toxin-antitoxin system